LKRYSQLKSYSWIAHEMKWGPVLLIFLSLALSAVIGVKIPQVISELYEGYGTSTYLDTIMKLLWLVLAQCMVQMFYQGVMNFFIKTMILKTRVSNYKKWLYADEKVSGGDELNLGEVLACLINDAEALKELLTSGAHSLLIDFIFVFSILLGFLHLNSELGVSLFIVEIGACLLLLWMSKFIARIFQQVRSKYGELAKITANLLGGIAQLFYHPTKNYVMNKNEKAFDNFLTVQLRANLWDAGYYAFAEGLYPIFLVFLILISYQLNLVEIVLLGAMVDIIQRSITPIKDIASKISSFQRASIGLKRMNDFRTHMEVYTLHSSPTKVFSKIEFSLETFAYQNKSKNNEQFQIAKAHLILQKGMKYAIVGESGSGKSTLLKILSGELISRGSKIRFDGEELVTQNYSDLSILRSQVVHINQEAHLFHDTLRFNISFGEEQGFEEFWKQVVSDIPYLQRFAHQLDQVISEEILSHGQRQLIAVLRCLFRPRSIIILDEISSFLDSDLELALRLATQRLATNAILITVAHRLETIIESDLIFFMKAGAITNRGNHQQLLSDAMYLDYFSQLHSQPVHDS
jgi:ABC-type multidrug transport system fused ATPase/permease subunit